MHLPKTRLAFATLVLAALAVGNVLADEAATDPVKSIDVHAAEKYVQGHDNAVIVDVRTPVEFDMSHITGAINVNVQSDDFESLVADLDRNKTYLVHCTKNPQNGRSSRALETMKSLGFRNLYSLEGGYVAWKEAELPLTEVED